jgi:hypothetical protein
MAVSSGGLAQWTTSDVSGWLAEQGLSTAAQRVTELGVDGSVLLELDLPAWKELGVESAVRRCQLVAAIKAEGLPADAQPAAAATVAEATSSAATAAPIPTVTFQQADKHCTRFGLMGGAKDGAAEHLLEWHRAVATSVSGGEAKNHVLGFLGMYNVLALLVFTIAFTCLYSMPPILPPAENRAEARSVAEQVEEYIDATCLVLYVFSAIYSFFGINVTSIAYNTSSACSEANATAFFKMPSTAMWLKEANDLCLCARPELGP